MNNRINKKKRLPPALVCAFIIPGSFFLFHTIHILFPGVIGPWDWSIQDNLFRLRYTLSGREKTSSYIIHGAVTDRTIAEEKITLGDREVYGRLINILHDAGAQAIAFDILFQDPVGQRPISQNPPGQNPVEADPLGPGDNTLVTASGKAGNLYYPLVLYEQLFPGDDGAGEEEFRAKALWNPRVTGNPRTPGRSRAHGESRNPLLPGETGPRKAASVIAPFPQLMQNTRGLGHINTLPDPDGIIRRTPLVYAYEEGYIPSLPLRMVCDFLQVNPGEIEISFGHCMVLKNAIFPGGMKKDIRIPIDRQGQVRLNFAGPWKDSFYEFAAEKLLDGETDVTLMSRLRDQIEGGMVLISDISVRNNDKSTGIFDPVYPNSEIHSTLINMILTDTFVYETRPGISWLMSLILGAILWAGTLRQSNWRFYTIVASAVILFASTTIVAFLFFRVFISAAVQISGFLFAFLGVSMYRFYVKEQETLEFSLKAAAAEEINQAKDRFIRYISHDLKNPLMPITGLIPSLLTDIDVAEMNSNTNIKNDSQGDDGGAAGKNGTIHMSQDHMEATPRGMREKLLLMQRSAYKLEQYVDELLDLIKIDAGTASLACSQADSVPFIKHIFDLFQIPGKKKNLTMEFTPPREPIPLWFDKKKLDKVISNLLTNALKFTSREGTISLSISHPLVYSEEIYPWTWTRPKPGKVICISIKDNGPGIPAKDLPHVFTPFFQSVDEKNHYNDDSYHGSENNHGTGSHRGAGIGLALAAEYVKLHYGHITVKSEEKEGSEFIIYLPVGGLHLHDNEKTTDDKITIYSVQEYTKTDNTAQQLTTQNNTAKAPDTTNVHQPVEKEVTGAQTRAKELILIVDDDPEILAFIAQSIGDRYMVIEAEDGSKGYELAVTRKPDIVLSDIMMPGIGGLELAGKIKADPGLEGIFVVLMTGNHFYDQKGESFFANADDFIKKGFTSRELLKRIENLLASRNSAPAINRETARQLQKGRGKILATGTTDRGKNFPGTTKNKESVRKGTWPEYPVLIVDDDREVLDSYVHGLGNYGITNIITEHNSRKVMDLLAVQPCISLCILDIHMEIPGMTLLPRIKEEYPDIPVIMATGIKSLETALYCTKKGAHDYIEKPVNFHTLAGTIKNVLKIKELTSTRKNLLTLKPPGPRALAPFKHIITSHPDMYRIFTWMAGVAPTREHILILGESGVGKELLAEGIHQAGKRTGKFVKVNVAGCDDHLFSDTLFGHKKGAFSGAEKNRDGLLKSAHNGTIFLDEIGDLEQKSQVKLLRLLESGEYYPLGSDEVELLTARVITATNANLKERVKEGRFRLDLENRLSVIEVEIPPLRDRMEDLEKLLDFFIEQAAGSFRRKNPGYDRELIYFLQQYHFPGNIRELKNMVIKVMSKHKGEKPLSTGDFREEIKARLGSSIQPVTSLHPEEFYFSGDFPTLEYMEKVLIREALKRKTRITDAAGLLGIDRFKLGRLKKKYGSP